MKAYNIIVNILVFVLLLGSTALAATPTLTTPATSNQGSNQVTLSLQADTTGTGYFTLLPGSGTACGSGAQVQAGQDAIGSAAFRKGSLPLTASTPGSYTIRNLTASTAYTACFTADDGVSLQGTPVSVNITTTAAATFAVPGWGLVGSGGFSDGQADFNSLTFAPDGTPYVAYKDYVGTFSQKATVMKYNGSAWVAVGNPRFSAGQADWISLAIAPDGTPFIAYQENGNKATVMKYNGSAWVTVGSAGFSAYTAAYTSLAIAPDGTPHVAYMDGSTPTKATVMKYNGSAWVTVGDAGFSSGSAWHTSLAFGPDGSPYVAYSAGNKQYKASVMKFSNGSWSLVGIDGFSVGYVNSPTLAFSPDGTPHVAYSDVANSSKATVMKFNGSSWVPVGEIGFSAGQADYISLAFSADGSPSVAYRDYANAYKATVMKYDGSAWSQVVSAAFSTGTAYYLSLAFAPDGAPFVAYQDSSSSKATVMRIASAATVTTGNVSAITSSGATLNATVNANDFAATASFQYGTDTGYTLGSATATPASITGSSDTAVSASISGLACSTVYHFRATAINSGGTAYGLDNTFTSSACPLHTISYNGNGLTSGSAPVDGNSYATDATVILPGVGSMMKTGYTLAGWNTAANGSGTGYLPGGSYIMGASYANVTLYAVWQPTVMVSASGIGAVRATATFTSGASGTGWYTMLAGSGTTCGSSSQIKLGKDSGGAAALRAGSLTLTASTPANYYFANLTLATPYTVCFTAADSSGITQATPASVSFTTTALASYSSPQWLPVGTAGFTNDAATWTSLAFAPDGAPWLAFKDAYAYDLATVKRFDGSNWNSIGDDGMSTAPVLSTAFGFAPNGVPFATFGLTPDSNGIVLGMGYSNSYGWDLLSYSDYLGYGDGMIAQSITPDGTLAVAFRDISNSRASVTLYYYGDFAYFSDISADTVDYLTIASAPDNSIYLAYSDNSVGGKATVKKLDESGLWSTIGSDGFSNGAVSHLALAVDNSGVPYLAYADGSDAGKAKVVKYDGSDWVAVGSAISSGATSYLSVAIDPANNLWLAFTDASTTPSNKATVMKYDGSSWSAISGTGISAGQANYLSLALSLDGTPYLAYSDIANGSKATVLRLVSGVAPVVTTGAASNITATSVTLNGTVNAGGVSTTVGFEYGTSTSYGNSITATQSPLATATDTAVSAAISGLTCGTVYHFRVIASNNNGSTSGSDTTVTTSPCTTATLAITISGNGSVTSQNQTGTNYTCNSGSCAPVAFNQGDTVTLTATGSNSTFNSWSGDYVSSSNPGSITMNANKAVTATFSPGAATVKIDNDSTPYYSINSALAAPTQDAIIRATATGFTENVTMQNSHTLTLKGGYSDNNFSSQTGYSSINGSLTVSSGTLIVDRVVVGP